MENQEGNDDNEEKKLTEGEKKKIDRKIIKILKRVGKNRSYHKKCLQNLVDLKNSVGNDGTFCGRLFKYIRPILSQTGIKKEEGVERLFSFIIAFISHGYKNKNYNFLFYLLSFLLNYTRANSKGVRFRVCELIHLLMRSVPASVEGTDEQLAVFDEMEKALLESLSDRIAAVRKQAVYAVHRLQASEGEKVNTVLKKFKKMIAFDENRDVRKSIVDRIELSKTTRNEVAERCRDVSPLVRFAVYDKFLTDDSKELETELLIHLFSNGLKERVDWVREKAKEFLAFVYKSSSSYKYYPTTERKVMEDEKEKKEEEKEDEIDEEKKKNITIEDIKEESVPNVFEFLGRLKVEENEELCESVLFHLFKDHEELLRINFPKKESLTNEIAFFWKCLYKYCHPSTYSKPGDMYDRSSTSFPKSPPKSKKQKPNPTGIDRYKPIPREDFGGEAILQQAHSEFAEMKEFCRVLIEYQSEKDMFIATQLLEISQFIDYGDEHGRNQMTNLLARMLSTFKYPDRFVDEIISVLEICTPSADVFTNIVMNEVEKLYQVSRDSETTRQNIGYVLRILRILTRLLQKSYSVGKLMDISHIEYLLQLVVLPSFDHELEPVQELSVLCLGQFCGLKYEETNKHLRRFVKRLSKIIEYQCYEKKEKKNLPQLTSSITFNLLKSILDMLLEHSTAKFVVFTKEPKEIDFYNHLIEAFDFTTNTDFKTLVIEGVVRLILFNRIVSKFVKRKLICFLILTSFNPDTEKFYELRQILSLFFQVFPQTVDDMVFIKENFIECLRYVVFSERKNPFSRISLSKNKDGGGFAQFLVELTDTKKVPNLRKKKAEKNDEKKKEDEEIEEEGEDDESEKKVEEEEDIIEDEAEEESIKNYHDDLVIEVCFEVMAKDTKSKQASSLCRILNQFEFDEENDLLKRKIRHLIGLIKEKTNNKLIAKYLSNLEKKVEFKKGKDTEEVLNKKELAEFNRGKKTFFKKREEFLSQGLTRFVIMKEEDDKDLERQYEDSDQSDSDSDEDLALSDIDLVRSPSPSLMKSTRKKRVRRKTGKNEIIKTAQVIEESNERKRKRGERTDDDLEEGLRDRKKRKKEKEKKVEFQEMKNMKDEEENSDSEEVI